MSNDKPRLRFSTIEIHIVKIMVDGIGIIIIQFLQILYRRQFNSQQSSKAAVRYSWDFRCPSSPSIVKRQ